MGFFTQSRRRAKQFICIKWQLWLIASHAFLFLLAKAGLSFPSFGESEFVEE
jgi:type II secretory pathway component PulL